VSRKELQTKLIAELNRQADECERGIVSVGMTPDGAPIAALSQVAPSLIYYSHVLALLPDGEPFIFEVGMN